MDFACFPEKTHFLLILGGFRTFYFSSSKIMEGVRYSDVRYNRGDGMNVVMKILHRAIILTSIRHRIIPNIRVKFLDSTGGIFCPPAGGTG